MGILLLLFAVSLTIGGGGLALFMWALRSGQYEDMEGAATRILFDDDQAPAAAPRKPIAHS